MPDNAKPTPQELPTSRTDKFVRIYANAANLEVTPWDFKMIFGELKKSSDGKPVIEQSVEVTMSPQHAKALADILSVNVREYEKNVGEIKLPRTPDASASPQKPVSAAS
jgi:hypothetical protein